MTLRAEMQCKHPKAKPKLVAMAIVSKIGHEQWLEKRLCCTFCGCITNHEIKISESMGVA